MSGIETADIMHNADVDDTEGNAFPGFEPLSYGRAVTGFVMPSECAGHAAWPALGCIYIFN